ncbi:hypothetical protein SEA_CUMBERBATCH_47 [Streptomyces phage Cumberbatch]|uniref:Uncharacterized protein n=1 Tax=Streptomyces phage Cumberbatch TaxID=2736271 RepID=A0A6M9Z5W2_9CAUD|nr:hypothetical protein QEN65_gp47 [Streptomyces phage Cumberbatch]QKN87689.1 hypothetical protein SEA_CUMBERBATCH_47 [Streptomyces phage Cumberbatch]
MTSTPDAVAVASLDTHRLILTVPNEGPADVASNLPRPAVAKVLRFVADQFGPAPAACDNCGCSPRCCACDTDDDLRAELAKLIRWHKEDGDQLTKLRTTIEQLRAERAELIKQRDRIANDTIKALVEQPANGTEAAEDMARRFARRLNAVEQLCSGHPGYHSITVKQLLTAMSDADDDQTEEQPEEATVPTVGDRYVKRLNPGQIVTVTSVWTAEDGHTAVAYEWHAPRASHTGSACPLSVFRRGYRPAAEAGR